MPTPEGVMNNQKSTSTNKLTVENTLHLEL
jgi:hypothetical protein